MRNAIYEFDPVVFPLMLFVAVADSDEFLEENFRSVKGEDLRMSIGENDANTFYYLKRKDDDRRGILIQIPSSSPDVEIIAHESYHYARRLLEYCNDEGSNETYALLVGWAAKCVDKAAKEYQAETNRLYEQGIICSGDIPTTQKELEGTEYLHQNKQKKYTDEVLAHLFDSGKISIELYVEYQKNPSPENEIEIDLALEKNGEILNNKERSEPKAKAVDGGKWKTFINEKPHDDSLIYARRVGSKDYLHINYNAKNNSGLFLLGGINEVEWKYSDQ